MTVFGRRWIFFKDRFGQVTIIAALVPNDRQFSDGQIRCLIERGAVIGGVLDAWMLVPDWQRGQTTPEESGVKLEGVITWIIFANWLETPGIGIGTDLDGGYGREQSPGSGYDYWLQRLPGMLATRVLSRRTLPT